MIDTLISAIENRQEIKFTYSGSPRIAQPAAVGESSKGSLVLRCYQTQGEHVTPGEEWDLCSISDIEELEITTDTFLVDPPDYKRGDRNLRRIYAQL
jgi:hypothetical protein